MSTKAQIMKFCSLRFEGINEPLYLLLLLAQ
jgi:hypothetical protein